MKWSVICIGLVAGACAGDFGKTAELPLLLTQEGVWKKDTDCKGALECEYDFHAHGWQIQSVGLVISRRDARWFVSKDKIIYLSFKRGACYSGCWRLTPAAQDTLEQSLRTFLHTHARVSIF